MENGIYRHVARGTRPVVHAIEVRNDRVVRAWAYQIHGEYREPGFAPSITGRNVKCLNLTNYRKG
jgi:hypothetical protein